VKKNTCKGKNHHYDNSMRNLIYGIFEKDKCIYVGRTTDSLTRRKAHQSNFGKQTEFRILKGTRKSDAAIIEKDLIAHYKKIGQANFNAKLKCRS
jgi:hypothetical protein